MIYPYTLLLHGLMAVLASVSLLYLFQRNEHTRERTVKLYFNWFFFFCAYNIFLVLPLLFLHELNLLAGIAYLTALLFLGLGARQAFVLGLIFSRRAQNIQKQLSILYLVGVTIAVFLHALFFEIPQGTPDGNWVLWYSNKPISLVYIFFMFCAGWTLAFVLFKNAFSLEKTLMKIRAILLALSAFLLPFAALFYFGATDVIDFFISFFLVGVAMVSFIIGNVGVGFFMKSQKQLTPTSKES